MKDLNKVLQTGRLTRDPDLRYTPSGQAAVSFSMAVNDLWIKDGEKNESVCFVEVACFGRLAENVGTYCHKGSKVLVEGKLCQDQWEDKATGAKRSKHKVMASSVMFLDSKGAGGQPQEEEY